MNAPLFGKRHTNVGARPGTLVIPKEAPPPQITTIHYNEAEHRVTTVDCVEEQKEAIKEGEVTWVGIQGFGDRSVMRKIGTMFDLHPF